MTIRTKLNLAVAIMISIFLLAGLITLKTVSLHADHTRMYSQVRKMSHLAALVRTDIYQHLASIRLGLEAAEAPDGAVWPSYVLDDIDYRIDAAEENRERQLWQATRDTVVQLSKLSGDTLTRAHIEDIRQVADVSLRALRNMYDLREHELIAKSAKASLAAQKAVGLACVLTMVSFLVYMLIIRKWLLKPVGILKKSADVIGDGYLGHRVPLTGDDEFAQLARRIDAMAMSLARHQEALLGARELSAVGELCTNVAHGLRNPLAAIRASAQLTLQFVDDQERLTMAMRDIISQADRMNNRITELFEFSRPMELKRECTTFREIAEAACADAQPLLGTCDITVAIMDESRETICCVDRAQMAAAVAELLTNAAHHSERGSEVSVRGDHTTSDNGRDERLRIQVRDHGSGMAQVTLEKSFTPFFSCRENGTGMGLAMVRRIVERHGGDIQIESELGVGTTATIRLTNDCVDPNASVMVDEYCRESFQSFQERQRGDKSRSTE